MEILSEPILVSDVEIQLDFITSRASLATQGGFITLTWTGGEWVATGFAVTIVA